MFMKIDINQLTGRFVMYDLNEKICEKHELNKIIYNNGELEFVTNSPESKNCKCCMTNLPIIAETLILKIMEK